MKLFCEKIWLCENPFVCLHHTKKTHTMESYMNSEEVTNYLESNGKWTLASIVEEVCRPNVSLGTAKAKRGIYYSTQDLRNVIVPKLFREMECSVITYIFDYN